MAGPTRERFFSEPKNKWVEHFVTTPNAVATDSRARWADARAKIAETKIAETRVALASLPAPKLNRLAVRC